MISILNTISFTKNKILADFTTKLQEIQKNHEQNMQQELDQLKQDCKIVAEVMTRENQSHNSEKKHSSSSKLSFSESSPDHANFESLQQMYADTLIELEIVKEKCQKLETARQVFDNEQSINLSQFLTKEIIGCLSVSQVIDKFTVVNSQLCFRLAEV